MNVLGNSGFLVELTDAPAIRKSCSGPAIPRLKRQLQKQASFYEHLQTRSIRTPRITKICNSPHVFWAEMEYISAKDFVQFLSEATREQLSWFAALIVNFVQSHICKCRLEDVRKPLHKKLSELAERNVPVRFLEAAADLCDENTVVPVGVCHGDLTLSNVLFRKDEVYLLDFLDCFVESPLQDVVKLRQDTHFGWSLQLYQANADRTKLSIAFRFLDRRIVEAFTAYDWYRRHYRLFQLVNFMRIIPYCRTLQTLAHATRSAEHVLKYPVEPCVPYATPRKPKGAKCT